MRKLREIPLTQGKVALVDDEDYDWLSPYSWRYNNNGYARTVVYGNSTRKDMYMHRMILRADQGMIVDHINGDKLDNRRDNLRKVSAQENSANSAKKSKRNQYKGATWSRVSRKWMAQISHNYTYYYLGLFDTEEEAAHAYNEKAVELFGDYARLNDIKGAA